MNSTIGVFLPIVGYISIGPPMPRFIISVRELYDRDLYRRQNGTRSEFGVLSRFVASEDAVVSAITFADVHPGQEEGQVVEGGSDDSEGIRLEVFGRWYPAGLSSRSCVEAGGRTTGTSNGRWFGYLTHYAYSFKLLCVRWVE